MSERIFCVDCKNFDEYQETNYFQGCWIKNKEKTVTSIKKKQMYDVSSVIGVDRNHNNDCKLYERKWWKFWR